MTLMKSDIRNRVLAEIQLKIREAISSLSEKTIIDLSSNYGSLQVFEQLIRKELELTISTVEEKVEQKRMKELESRKDAREKQKALRVAWAKANLRVGMIVKVESSASSRIRKVTKIDDASFVGMHLKLAGKRRRSTQPVEWELAGYITEHMFDKITHIISDDPSATEVKISAYF